LRRIIAVALALSLLGSTLSGCSQPIDTGSTVPPQSQPIVAILALVAIGIGLTAYHHHNEEHHGGGPGSTIVPPAQVLSPLFTGYRATQLAVDSFDAGIGVLESPTVSGTDARFALVTGTTFNYYALPAGYLPIAAAVDPNGNDWFVDQNGNVQGCAAPATGVLTCVPGSIAFSTTHDGLGTGTRSVAVDDFNLFIDRDGGGGLVKWFAFNLSGDTTQTATYQSTSTSGLYPTGNVESTPPSSGVSGFAVFHTDGRSDLVTLSPVADAPNFTFSPVPLVAPSDQVQAVDLNDAFYATTGSSAATYRLARYENANPTGVGELTTASITIAVNGQTGAPSSMPYALPLSSVQADAENNVWAVDASGNIVQFGQF
jgi:hypothetical protein